MAGKPVVLRTGSKSNVDPSHFGQDVLDLTQPLDPERDAWTLPLIRRMLAIGMPFLANGVRVEAVAPDGVIEAFSFEGARAFSLCVQWHPEWQAADNPVSMRLLRVFGDAVRRYRDEAAARVAAGAALA